MPDPRFENPDFATTDTPPERQADEDLIAESLATPAKKQTLAERLGLTRREAAIAWKQVLRAEKNAPLPIPGWDDVVHIIPDAALDPIDLYKRKVQRARQMIGAQPSELASDVTWLMTKIDDIQDGFVTLSVGTRLLGTFIPALRPAAQLFGKAADVLGVGTIFKTAKAAPPTQHCRLRSAMKDSPGYYQGRVKQATSLAKALPNIAETLQIMQTSDQLTGIGLSLGALTASPQRLIKDYQRAATLGAQSRAREAADPSILEDPDRLYQNRVAETRAISSLITDAASATALAVIAPAMALGSFALEQLGQLVPKVGPITQDQYDASTDVLTGAFWTSGGGHTFSPNDHLLISTAYSLALATYTAGPPGYPAAALAHRCLDIPFSPRAPRDPTTRAALKELGIDPNDPGRFPLRGSPARITYRDAIAELSEIAPAKVTAWRDALPTDEEKQYAGFLHTHQARAPWPILEGPNVQIETGYPRIGRAGAVIMDFEIWPPDELQDAALWALLTDLGDKWFAKDTKHPRYIDAIRDMATWLYRHTPELMPK